MLGAPQNRDGSQTVKALLEHAERDYGWIDRRQYDAYHRRRIVSRALEQVKGDVKFGNCTEEELDNVIDRIELWLQTANIVMPNSEAAVAIQQAVAHEKTVEAAALRADEAKKERGIKAEQRKAQRENYVLFKALIDDTGSREAAIAKLSEDVGADEANAIERDWKTADDAMRESVAKEEKRREERILKTLTTGLNPSFGTAKAVYGEDGHRLTWEEKTDLLKERIDRTGDAFMSDDEIMSYATGELGMHPAQAKNILKRNRVSEEAVEKYSPEISEDDIAKWREEAPEHGYTEREIATTLANINRSAAADEAKKGKSFGGPTQQQKAYAAEFQSLLDENGGDHNAAVAAIEKNGRKRGLSETRARELAVDKHIAWGYVNGKLSRADISAHRSERMVTVTFGVNYGGNGNEDVTVSARNPKSLIHNALRKACNGQYWRYYDIELEPKKINGVPVRGFGTITGHDRQNTTKLASLSKAIGFEGPERVPGTDGRLPAGQEPAGRTAGVDGGHKENNPRDRGLEHDSGPRGGDTGPRVDWSDVEPDGESDTAEVQAWRDSHRSERMDTPDPNALYSAKESQVHHGVIGENFKSRAHKRNEKLRGEAEELRKKGGWEFRKVIEDGRSGKILTDVQVVAILLDQADRLKQSMDGSLDADAEESNQKAIKYEAEALRYGLSEAAAALAAAKFGVDLRTMDTVAYIRSQLKAKMEREIEKEHGATAVPDYQTQIEKELAKKDARISEMAAEMQKLHDQIDEQKKAIEEKEKNADDQAVNRIADEAYRKGLEEGVAKGEKKANEAEVKRRTESIDRLIKELGFDEEYAGSASDALDELGDVFGVEKHFAGNPTSALNDRARRLFAIVLRGAGNDETKARAAIDAKYGGIVTEMFDKFVAEENARAVSPDGSMEGKRKTRRRNIKELADETDGDAGAGEVDVSDTLNAKRGGEKRKIHVRNAGGRTYVERLIDKCATMKRLSEESEDESLRMQYVGEYARLFFKLAKIASPAMNGVALVGELVSMVKSSFPDIAFDESDARDALLMRGDFKPLSKGETRATLDQLKKAAAFLVKNPTKVAEAAKMAGIEYVSDAALLMKLDRELGRMVDKMINKFESRINEEDDGELGREIHKYIMALHELRSGKPVGDLLAKYLNLAAGLKDYRRQRSVLDRIQSRIEMYERKLANKDFEPTPKRENPDTLKELKAIKHAEMDLERLRQRFRHERDTWRASRGPLVSRTLSSIGEILGELKAIAGSIDLSSVLRQGGQMTWAHPLLAIKNMKRLKHVLKSDKNANDAYDSIFDRPNAKYYQLAGIDFTIWGDNSADSEDLFLLNQYRKITKLKLIRAGVECSERAFSMYLNLMRADVFDAMVRNSPFRDASNMSVEQLKALGNYINVASQRGMIDQSGNMGKALKFLNAIFWSPRNIVSRWNFIWETAKLAIPGTNPYGATDAKMRGMIAKEIARYVTGVGIAMAFAKMMADLFRDGDEPPEKMVFDPRSSQFLEVKVGNTHLDFLSRLKQMIVFGSRMFSGKTVNARGQIQEANRLEKIGSFMRSKFAPASSILYDAVVTREDFEKRDILWHEPFKGKEKDEIGIARYMFGQITPLSLGDVVEHFSENNGIGRPFGTAILAMLGLGANTYDSNTYKQLKGDFQYYRKLWNEMDSQEERLELEARHPVFKRNEGAIVAWIRETEKCKRQIRQIEKTRDAMKNPDKGTLAGIEDSLKTLRDMYERCQKIALNHMVGIKNPTSVD